MQTQTTGVPLSIAYHKVSNVASEKLGVILILKQQRKLLHPVKQKKKKFKRF